MKRRNFIKTTGIGALAVGTPIIGNASSLRTYNEHELFTAVQFTRDGLDLNAAEYHTVLGKIIDESGISMDNYSRGGVVDELEQKMAKLLGKEAAVFMPTGTLANHIALRKLSGNKHRVIVQADSHIYRDSGDCTQNLSQLNLIPLKTGEVDFTLPDVMETHRRTRQGRVKNDIGTISIESPVRRHNNKMFDFKKMQEISFYARENGMAMHMDGARLFNACVHADKSPADFANLFDTVYVSMYKNFNAPSGAILAGTKEFCEDLYQTRRMFGGGMPQVWPLAAIANYYVESFLNEYKKAWKHAKTLFDALEKDGVFTVEYLSQGTNIVILKPNSEISKDFQDQCLKRGVTIWPTYNNALKLKINPTILRKSVDELASIFMA